MSPAAPGPGDAQAILETYLQELPLDETRRAALRIRLEPALQRARGDAGARTAVLTELHRELSQDAQFDSDNPAKASLAARLRLAMAGAHKRGDDHAAGIFTTDVQGRARLVTTPPLARASMIFLPWGSNPLQRFWRWTQHAVFGLRGMAPLMAGSRSPLAADQRPLWPWLLTRLLLAALLVSQIGNIKHLVPSPLGQKAVFAAIIFALTMSLFGLFGSRGLNPLSSDPRPEGSPDRRVRWRASGRNRRLFLISLIFAQTWFATYYMTAVLPYHGAHVLEKAILVLYVILFVWVSLGFWTALMGFFLLLMGRDKHSINASAAADIAIPAQTRTAILVPICNEDVARVYAGIRATYDSVMRSGKGQHFDFYILSDTGKADVRVAELEAWLRLCREVDGFGRIYYRRRHHRIKRKSGNIADWCRRWGSLYQYMIILDADSVMSGACLVRLTQLMEANPGAGIIQTAPRAAGRDTAYARIQQFATRAYGPLFTSGLHFWQLGESHYWGHNAIIRVRPFMQHCALGRLPGRGALAGEIMSHDFVEAALMRRAGWAVWIAYDLPGSYEEMPPALLDELRRDQRWCQGNLQNFRLFLTRGLHPAHRAVFMTGVMAYISAPLWFLFLALSTALLWVQTKSEPQYFTQPEQLFPTWPEWHPEWAAGLAALTAVLLFLPKLLGAVLILARRSELKLYGGPFKLIDSLFMEMIFSALLAPVRMLFHTRYVTFAMLGFAVQWKSPPRDDAQTPWSEAIKRHIGGTILGIAWIGLVHWLNPSFLPWLLPVAGAMVVAIPLSVVSSRADLGRWLRERRMFLIPEETFPPRELRWTRAAHRKSPDYDGGFIRAIVSPITNAIAAAAANPRDRLPEQARIQRARLVALAQEQGPEKLNEAQRNALLSDPAGLVLLHQRHWAEKR